MRVCVCVYVYLLISVAPPYRSVSPGSGTLSQALYIDQVARISIASSLRIIAELRTSKMMLGLRKRPERPENGGPPASEGSSYEGIDINRVERVYRFVSWLYYPLSNHF